MAADTRNLTITQGEEFNETYTWTASGDRQSLEGWAPRAQMRQAAGGPLVMDFTPYLSVVNDVAVNGTTGDGVQLRIPAHITRGLTRGGVWDLFLVDAIGGEQVRAKKLTAGRVAVRLAVTVNG